MNGCESRCIGLNVSSRFSHNLEVADDSVLNKLIREELGFCHASGIDAYSFHGFQNVLEIIGHSDCGIAHISAASASTLSRNFAGRSKGVSTSTVMPKRFWMLSWIRATSRRLVSLVG